MCGIAGWINRKADLSNQEAIVASMILPLAPRGPDASGIWTSAHAAIGHRRLVVVDPVGGGQPMIREWGGCTRVLTYNGELYNTSDLRQELEKKGHYFYSTSDTEVLLVSYIEWGTSCVKHLNGIFAFAIWDEKMQILFLARDRFGVKPLFYTKTGSNLIFGSELKSILAHPLVKREVGGEGLSEIFALGPARTPGHGVFKDILELKPAHCMVFEDDEIKIYSYWSLESKPHEDSIEKTIQRVRELTMDSVTRQLAADVPVCTFLSGGLDSSAITACAAGYFYNRDMGDLHTFSVDYENNDKYFKASDFQPNPDAPWVTRMSEAFGTIHDEILIDTPQLVEALKAAVIAKDLPGMADVDSSLWLFCQEIRKQSTVALSGECADEIFGGYPWFHREEMINADTFPWSRFIEERTRVLSPCLNEVIHAREYSQRRYMETLEEVPRLAGEDPIEARRREIFYLNIIWFMQTLLERKDRMSMAHGLEIRVPFCDHRLVEYVWNIPWNMKMHKGREKGILRQALEGILPEDVLWRKKSPYPKTHNPAYEAAVKEWLLEILNDSTSPLLPLVNKDAICSLAGSKSDTGKPWFGQLMATPQLFAYLIQVDIWLREYRVSI